MVDPVQQEVLCDRGKGEGAEWLHGGLAQHWPVNTNRHLLPRADGVPSERRNWLPRRDEFREDTRGSIAKRFGLADVA